VTVAAPTDGETERTLGCRNWWRRPALIRLGGIVFLLMIWELTAQTAGDPLFFSPPSAVVAAVPDVFGDRVLLRACALTLGELAIAFALAVAVGSLAGVLVGANRLSRRSLYPMILLAYAVPQTTVLPLFILLFGPGAASKVAFGFSHGVFPVLIAVIGGVQAVRPALITCARSMGASRLDLLRLVVLPCIVPSLFTGMRLGMSATLLGILLAELYVTSAGIGQFTHAFTDTFQPAKLFALSAGLAAMAVILNESMRRIEGRHNRWRR
jgi:NitT/TauT family transport system permease protein